LVPEAIEKDAQRSRFVGPVVPDVPIVPVGTGDAPSAGAGIIARRRTRSSPVVRRIAADHSIDISRLTGSGISGRVTRRDIEGLVRQQRGSVGRPLPGPPPYAPGDKVRIEKMSVMRKKIAEHMRMSVQTSPHVYSTYEVDFANVDALRVKHKSRYESAGTKLTYTVFIARATVEAIRECPFANASIDEDTVIYKDDINLGIAVALEQGLIVPVIRRADRLSMMDLSRAVQDLAERARTKQLKVDEVQGGTFTITNPGIFGAAFGLPIISQPQVAILAVGSIDKRPAVVNDQVMVHPMCYITLGHDHRLIDGAEGARFLRAIKERLEHFDEGLL
jgi:2-oxoglutarate dehydrogenase E2 component (dihydrolipoamide succinyltransferase)